MVAIPATAVTLWWSGMRAKEAAVAIARLACQREAVQLLDQTVVLKQMRPARDSQGRFCWRREYQFEFTSHDAHRDRAQLELLGLKAKQLRFPYQRDADGNRIYQH
ncbi:MAG: DUF3301 domain-containing protein [Granulosicoccaceae bacterium]